MLLGVTRLRRDLTASGQRKSSQDRGFASAHDSPLRPRRTTVLQQGSAYWCSGFDALNSGAGCRLRGILMVSLDSWGFPSFRMSPMHGLCEGRLPRCDTKSDAFRRCSFHLQSQPRGNIRCSSVVSRLIVEIDLRLPCVADPFQPCDTPPVVDCI